MGGAAIGGAAALGGSLLSSSGGGGGEGEAAMIEFDSTAFASSANEVLDRALEQAIPYSERGTQFAIEALKNFYTQSRKDVMEAEGRARIDFEKGHGLAQAKLKPFAEAGYGALDTYQDILGLPRFAAGSSAVAAAGEMKAKQEAARQALTNQGMSMMDSLGNKISGQDKMNLMSSIQSGGNPMGIMRALEQMGITGAQDRFRTDFTNPELKTLGGQIDEEGGLTGEQRGIPSILGNIANDLGRFSNDLYAQSFNQYLGNAMPFYNQTQNNRVPANMQSILNAIRGGVSTQGAVPTATYQRS
jgi:hypothetical protein